MRKEHKTLLIQILLFVLTFITTTLAGAEWAYSKVILVGNFEWNETYTWSDFVSGMEFSVPFMLFLTAHEFGHYFTAMYHKVRATLPYYIPFPTAIIPSIGSLGALIRIKERVRSNVQHFDIGLAGPLAGFVVAVIVLIYGFATLPPPEHIYTFHPEYEAFGPNYADTVYSPGYMQDKKLVDIKFGSNLLFNFLGNVVAEKERIPNARELMHYPLLLAGFIALFFTSMNLLPIGQLDGGHITYGLFGSRGHRIIATVFFMLLIFYAGLGIVSPYEKNISTLGWQIPLTIAFYYFCFLTLGFHQRDRLMFAVVIFAAQFVIAWLYPAIKGYHGWLVFGFIVSRLAGIQHPPSEIEVPLDTKRVVLGWIALIIFVVSFSLVPLEIMVPEIPQ
ncbi:MAG TPA: site-2 protease family protein [Ohtaekwangia sp.]|nr:site-2 protease family protein [Ohtaekwangia sp.]